MKHPTQSPLTKILFFLLLTLLCATPALASPTLDIDGNGTVDGGTDGLLVNRYLYGFRGDALIDGAVGSGCARCSAEEIEAYLASLAGGGGGEDTFTNSLDMTFVRIPAGTFMMGSPEDELGRGDNETQHEVTLTQDYYMMTTEVTQAQWEEVMGSNPSYFTACGGDCPVEQVSWNNIQLFIAELNSRDGRTYRLPTEAEWEYGARAETTTAFYNGDITQEGYDPIDPNLDAIGWYYGNSGNTTHPVAQKLPNAWGLYDMSGNVWEWVQDWYGEYPENSSVDPGGPSDGASRVVRGGSWNHHAQYCRSAYRLHDDPSIRYFLIGFRLALSPGR